MISEEELLYPKALYESLIRLMICVSVIFSFTRILPSPIGLQFYFEVMFLFMIPWIITPFIPSWKLTREKKWRKEW